MGADDKLSNKGQDLKGKVKESTGSAVGNESMEAEGKGDQAESSVKQGVEKVKDAAGDMKDAVKK